MRDYTRSRVLSLRIDAELLEAVRARAREQGRSVSGEVVFLIREHIERLPRSAAKPRPITGWLAGQPVLETHQEFRQARAAAGATLLQAARRKARRR